MFRAGRLARLRTWLNLPATVAIAAGGLGLGVWAATASHWVVAAILGALGLAGWARTWELAGRIRAQPCVWLGPDHVRIRTARTLDMVLPPSLQGGGSTVDLRLPLRQITGVHTENESDASEKCVTVLTDDAEVRVRGIGDVRQLHVALLEAVADAQGVRDAQPEAVLALARERFADPVRLRLDPEPGLAVGLTALSVTLVGLTCLLGVFVGESAAVTTGFAAMFCGIAAMFAGSMWWARHQKRWLELSSDGMRVGREPGRARLVRWDRLSSVHEEVHVTSGVRRVLGLQVNCRGGDSLTLEDGYVRLQRGADGELEEASPPLSARQLRQLLDLTAREPDRDDA